MAQQEKKFQEEKQSLESELERVTGQFQETKSKMRWEGLGIPPCGSPGSPERDLIPWESFSTGSWLGAGPRNSGRFGS